MFASAQRPPHNRWNLPLVASLAVHAVVLWIVCLRPGAIFVKPVLIARGDRGATTILYFSPPGQQQTLVAKRPRPVPARLHLPVKEKTPFNAKVTEQKAVQPQNSDPVSTASAGSPNGSDMYGAGAGADVRPAIETTLLDPPVSRSEIPPGTEGDVVVEITIDEQGNVIEVRLLKGLGRGIDEKILATVRNWHYRPATKDGVPIPSKNDHYWHFRG